MSAMHGNDHGGYVDKVREEMQTYVRGLIGENETLRVVIAEMENENLRLRQEVRSAREEIASHRSQEQRLREKLQEIRAASEQSSAQYAQLEHQSANLANLYVASYQLHGTVDRDAVLAAIQEIIVNLIGSEEFVIFERELGGGVMAPLASFGVDDPLTILREPHVAAALRGGETWVAEQPSDLTACVPLKLDGRVTGLIAIRRLLAHKSGLEPLDHELFDLLATHAAMALYCTALQARVAEQAIA